MDRWEPGGEAFEAQLRRLRENMSKSSPSIVFHVQRIPMPGSEQMYSASVLKRVDGKIRIGVRIIRGSQSSGFCCYYQWTDKGNETELEFSVPLTEYRAQLWLRE